jgi:tetrahydromethanopterin S-methyltransferase subunit B
MWTLPYSAPQKAGVILYGIVIGALMVPLTALACLLLGFCVATIEYCLGFSIEGSWALLGSLFYGFWLGIPVGIVVCWRFCRSRLREVKSEESC